MNTEGIGLLDDNNDGWLDLYSDNDGYGMALFANTADGSGTLALQAPATGGLPTGGGAGDYTAVSDVHLDGFPDLLRRSTSGLDLWANQGGGDCGDLDNDGDLDLMLADDRQDEIYLQDLVGGTWSSRSQLGPRRSRRASPAPTTTGTAISTSARTPTAETPCSATTPTTPPT